MNTQHWYTTGNWQDCWLCISETLVIRPLTDFKCFFMIKTIVMAGAGQYMFMLYAYSSPLLLGIFPWCTGPFIFFFLSPPFSSLDSKYTLGSTCPSLCLRHCLSVQTVWVYLVPGTHLEYSLTCDLAKMEPLHSYDFLHSGFGLTEDTAPAPQLITHICLDLDSYSTF